MSALDSLPLLGTASAAFGAACTAFGAWLKGRQVARASVAASHAKEHAASEETERAALAHDVALVPELMAELRAVRDEARRDREHAALEREKCRAENEALRRELDVVLEGQAASREERARLCAKVERMEIELARWHGAVPAGSD